MFAVLLVLSVPAGGEQAEDRRDKKAVSTRSTTPTQATFTSGSGNNRFEVRVSNHGNMTSFVSPAGTQNVSGGNEGYALCSPFTANVHGHDTGGVEAGFGPATIQQPTAGKFPVTITRNTTDGAFQLKQVWAKPDAAEKDVTVTMTVKNVSGAAAQNIYLLRMGDFDVGVDTDNYGAQTEDSVWMWNDFHGSNSGVKTGLMLSTISYAEQSYEYVSSFATWQDNRLGCDVLFALTPTSGTTDLAMYAAYLLGEVAAGASKTVKFVYSRM